MDTLNPNFPVPDEIVAELDEWFGKGKYTPKICWNDYGNPVQTYFVVVFTPTPFMHLVRLYKMFNFQSEDPLNDYRWAISVDVQERL